MKRLRIVVSLITQDNDFQIEQAASAEEAARRLGVDVEILYADNDSIEQSQQVLKFVQSDADVHPDGVILEPVGLEETINRVRQGPFDLRAANVIGFLAGILLKALDSGRVEERLAHLEAVMTGKRGTDFELFDFKSAKESEHEEQ